MTMQHHIHPDDERLAALAGGDPELVSDAALRAHVESCDRCGPTVRELGLLRTALGELPDLVPSRPLQLLPPVPEASAPARGGWLRRLAAPAMAAGFVLVLVGAIGSSGVSVNVGLGGAAAAPSMAEFGGQGDSASSESPLQPGPVYGAGGSPSTQGERSVNPTKASGEENANASPTADAEGPPADRGAGSDGLFAASDPRLPWLIVLGLGVGLLLAGIYLRFAGQPRAG